MLMDKRDIDENADLGQGRYSTGCRGGPQNLLLGRSSMFISSLMSEVCYK